MLLDWAAFRTTCEQTALGSGRIMGQSTQFFGNCNSQFLCGFAGGREGCNTEGGRKSEIAYQATFLRSPFTSAHMMAG
jgi:hypothetical protein